MRYTPSTGELRFFTEEDGLLSNKVRETLVLRSGDIAVATGGGVCILHDGRDVACYGVEQGLTNPVVLCLYETGDGTLLAGTDGTGIYTIRDGVVHNYGEADGLSSGVVLRMTGDPVARGVWISAGNALNLWTEEGIREISGFQAGVGSILDLFLLQDQLWLLKTDGAIAVSRDALLGKREMNLTRYTKDDGLGGDVTANSWSLVDHGVIYLCTGRGLSVLDTTHIPRAVVPPKVMVNQITVEDESAHTQTYETPGQLLLPATARRITIQFACLAYGSSYTLEYQLEGFDPYPIVVQARAAGAASYTNLPGGNYTFHLTARNADGVVSSRELTVALQKQRRPTELPLFWVAVVLAVVALGVAAAVLSARWKGRQMRRRQEVYREITDQAMRTIANTIDAKDKYTNGHSLRVGGYAREIARRMALLHDIGKIGIPDAILNKPGKLTNEEFEVMRSHTLIGGAIL